MSLPLYDSFATRPLAPRAPAIWRRARSLENTAFYAYAGGGAGRDEIYRFFNTKTGVHLYSNSENERDTIIATNPVFKYEGIAYYTDLVW